MSLEQWLEKEISQYRLSQTQHLVPELKTCTCSQLVAIKWTENYAHVICSFLTSIQNKINDPFISNPINLYLDWS